ncbi:MAG: FtsX-like permease family protein [Gemmatimonadota bacterium]
MGAIRALDGGSGHRVAGVFALAFAAAAITALAGVFAIDVRMLRLDALFTPELLPDASWRANWLPGAVTAAGQQRAAVEQWLHIVLIFAGIAAAIACINALIAFAAHANERRYETALRGLVGASPRQLARAQLKHSLLDGVIGAALGIATGAAAAVLLSRLWGSRTQADGAWVLFAFAACVASAAFVAHTTARRFRKAGWLGAALAPEARTVPGFGAEDLRALLTGAQLACAVALTIVSLLVWSYASAAARPATGATDRYVAAVTLEAGESAEHLRARLRAAGMASESIASPGALLGIGKVDKVVSHCGPCSRGNMPAPLFAVETQQHVIGSHFFRTAGIAVEAGREFDDRAGDDRAVVVNRSFAREAFQQQNPIGKRILAGGFERGAWYHVIGVVEDVHTRGLQLLEPNPGNTYVTIPAQPPAIYFAASTHPPTRVDVIVRSNTPPVALAGLGFEPLSELYARASRPQQSFSRVLSLFGLLVCGAAVLGSLVATMLSVRARRVEISVRRAVGARRMALVRLVVARAAGIALRGIVTGVVLSVALSRALEIFVPGLPAFQARNTIATAAAFFGVVLLATLLPLRAALRIPPAYAHD